MRTWFPDDKDQSNPEYHTSIPYEIEPGGHEFPLDRSPWHSNCDTYICPSCEEESDEWHECHAKVEMMACRAFWDMWDSNPDDWDMSYNSVYWTYLADIWTLFPSGTGNHQANESDPYFNMWDYHYNSAYISNDVYDDIFNANYNNSMWWQEQ